MEDEEEHYQGSDQAIWRLKGERKQHLGRKLIEEILLGLARYVNLRQLHQRYATHYASMKVVAKYLKTC